MRSHKITKRELKKQSKLAFKFIVSIIAFYTLLWLVIRNVDLYFLKAVTARAANALLSVSGVPSELVFGAEPSIIVSGVAAHITNLCAGDLEIALITAIILSTFDRTLRQRIWGVIGGILLVLILNPLRIFIVLAAGHFFSWQMADFAHDVLFRITLLLVIVLYYYFWYVKLTVLKKTGKKKHRKGLKRA